MSLGVLQYREASSTRPPSPRSAKVIDATDDHGDLPMRYYYRADSHYALKRQGQKACESWQPPHADLGDKRRVKFIVKQLLRHRRQAKIPKKPKRTRRKTTIQF
jgi:hypothetical protein